MVIRVVIVDGTIEGEFDGAFDMQNLLKHE